MKNTTDTCRLCLHSALRGRKIAIACEDFQHKLKVVFPFTIPPAENLPSDACRRCRETVEQFYEYSEKVRAVQDTLHADLLTSCNSDEIAGTIEDKSETKCVTELHDSNEPFSNESESVVKQEENLNVELLEVDYVKSNETTSQLVEPIEERLPEDMAEPLSTANDSFNDDGVINEEETLSDEQTSDEGKDKRSDTPPPAKRRNRPREEDEILLRKHYDLRCEKCPYKSETVADLFQHYRKDHQTPGYVVCCNRKFLRRARLLEHLGAHLGSMVCDVCDKVFRNLISLRLHKLDHVKPHDARQFKCDQCNYSFHKIYHLKQHQKRHERARCTICDKELAGENGLKRHMEIMHGTDNKRICPTCGIEFRSDLTMKRHIKAHMGIVEKERVQCDQCPKWFNSKFNLRQHMKGVHLGAGPMQCDECGHMSPNRSALANHKVRKHLRKQSFECEHCGKKLKTKLSLREHVATHTRTPLYSCEFCGVTFNSNANKYMHRKNRHPQEWEALMRKKQEEMMGGPNAVDITQQENTV